MVEVTLRQVNVILVTLATFLSLVGGMIYGIFQVVSAITAFEGKIDHLETTMVQVQSTVNDHSKSIDKVANDMRILQLRSGNKPNPITPYDNGSSMR